MQKNDTVPQHYKTLTVMEYDGSWFVADLLLQVLDSLH